MIKIKNRNGYIALTSLLIVAAVGLTIGISVSLRGMEEVQLSYGGSQAAGSKMLANACIEEGLERLRKNWVSYSGSLSFGANSCIIDSVVTDNNASLVATGSIDVYSQKIQIQVNNSFDVLSWQEY